MTQPLSEFKYKLITFNKRFSLFDLFKAENLNLNAISYFWAILAATTIDSNQPFVSLLENAEKLIFLTFPIECSFYFSSIILLGLL